MAGVRICPGRLLLVSDGDDWTRQTPKVEFPHLQRIYQLTGAPDNVENAHFADEGHDYEGHDEIGAWVATAAAVRSR